MFPYIGGKSHHVKWMDELFPESFDTFVEVFGGAGWVSVKSPKVGNTKRRVYNDFNPLLSNLYYCFSNHSTELLNQMEEYEKSNVELYREFQKELFGSGEMSIDRLGNIELAAKYAYLQTQIFAGTPLSDKNVYYFTEVKSNGKYPSKYETLKKKLRNEKILNRLHSIDEVRNADCIEVIKEYDSKDTFFYLDPPYYNMEFYYSKDFPKEKHAELAETLSNIKGKFALSYYDFEDLHNFYPNDKFFWYRKDVYRSASTRSSADEDFSKKSRGEEIFITNYDPLPSSQSVLELAVSH